MLSQIKNKLLHIKTGLSSINDRPIGKTVLTIVLFLDLFILSSLFQGLSDHTSQLVSPNEFIPQHCRDIVIDGDWNEGNRLIRIARLATEYRNRTRYTNTRAEERQVHPICAPVKEQMLIIKRDNALSENLTSYLRYRNTTDQFKSELERNRAAYDTSLLEDIAGQTSDQDGQSDVAAIRSQLKSVTERLNRLSSEESGARDVLLQSDAIQQLFSIIDSASPQDKDLLLEELRYLNFWFPVKRLGMEMIFLLPLIVIFYLWNSKSLAASRPYQRLVSSHLLVVVFIPVIFKVLELVYEILPKKLLKQVFDWLQSFNLVGIWYYLLMGIGITAALAMIYIMQQKIFSQEKIVQKRIAKGQCQNCGVHVPAGSNACSQCGFKQTRQCSTCNSNTFVYGKYCRECGASE